MIAYKFLRPKGGDGVERFVGPFSGLAWPLPAEGLPGAEVKATGPPLPGRDGISACRVGDLPLWIHQTLWAVELGGEIVELETKVVATRARLLHRVDGWNEDVMQAYAADSAEKVRLRAVHALRAAGHGDLAVVLERCSSLPEVVSVAERCAKEASERGAGELATVVWFASDAAGAAAAVTDPDHPSQPASHNMTAQAGYVSARALQYAEGQLELSGPYGADPYLEERQRQARWLANRLGLRDPSSGEPEQRRR